MSVKNCVYRTSADSYLKTDSFDKSCNCKSQNNWVRCTNEFRIKNIERISDLVRDYSRLIKTDEETILLINKAVCQKAHCLTYKT